MAWRQEWKKIQKLPSSFDMLPFPLQYFPPAAKQVAVVRSVLYSLSLVVNVRILLSNVCQVNDLIMFCWVFFFSFSHILKRLAWCCSRIKWDYEHLFSIPLVYLVWKRPNKYWYSIHPARGWPFSGCWCGSFEVVVFLQIKSMETNLGNFFSKIKWFRLGSHIKFFLI